MSTPMPANEYQQLAKSTESPPNLSVYHRFMHLRNRVTALFTHLREDLLEVDAIKKFLFYGKENVRFGLHRLEDEELPQKLTDLSDADRKFLRLLHAVLGVMSECEEWIDPILAGMQASNAIDHLNGVEEFGDVQWYVAIGSDALQVKLEEVLRANIAKLARRYPEKFKEAHAISRDLESEKQAMQGQLS